MVAMTEGHICGCGCGCGLLVQAVAFVDKLESAELKWQVGPPPAALVDRATTTIVPLSQPAQNIDLQVTTLMLLLRTIEKRNWFVCVWRLILLPIT